MTHAADLELLRAVAIARKGGRPRANGDVQLVEIVVSGCAYSCCGKGWRRRDGYEQTYRGWIDNLDLDDDGQHGTFMLYGGIGAPAYVVAVRIAELAAIELLPGP